jgi:hypothetical protein
LSSPDRRTRKTAALASVIEACSVRQLCDAAGKTASAKRPSISDPIGGDATLGFMLRR